jgi:CheY-like chemotaxis protein
MSKKILLADDSITIQKVIELTFSDEDFDVVTVGNGRLALEKLPEVRPDLVLCDIIMPEKDGYEVCEQIKTSPATAHIPVLLLTGAFEPFDQERAARAGYDGSLAKPFEPETLIAKVKDLLARAPAPPPVAVAPPPLVAAPPPVAAPPAVLPFQRPAPPPAPPAVPSFMPEEEAPGPAEEPAFSEQEGPSASVFAPMTEEESATLLAPPSPADTASTVMFRAGDLPWNAPGAPSTPAPPPVPEPRPSPGAVPPPEPVFVPETADTGEAVETAEEPAVFEEVLEEDLDFGEATFEPPAGDTSSTALLRPGAATLPPIAEDAGGTTGAFEPVKAADALEPEPVLEEETAVPFEPAPAPELPPAFAPEPVPVPEPPPAPKRAAFAPPVEPPPVAPRPPRPPVPAPAAESFADVAAAVAAPPMPAPPPSEAAAVSVPVEMVEKIAQRVVAQISEKAVREIAWEVIPDLAEALIKQEIERLKAELQKT